jgi:HptB-dependent secretion and biofilm anti anti-sigma factor
MNYALATEGDALNVTISGDMLALSHSQFHSMIGDVLAQAPLRCNLDVGQVDFMDSGGLGMLLMAKDTFSQKGIDMILQRPQGAVRRLLFMAKFDQLFTIQE